jgi:AmmeMemoRadiSam system protein B/AmmeMemoRadiSam system protein A
VKDPSVAGAFYPAEAAVLKRDVDRYLAAVRPTKGGARPVALVVPHAGHEYSGAIAAEAYGRLKGQPVSTVVLIGPSHHVPFNGAVIYPGEGMRTPLGVIPIATKTARRLVHDQDQVRFDATPFAREHSLEVQLPFIQRAFGAATAVVPILIGSPTKDSRAVLARDLGRILREDPHALLVISTDLSHYHDQATALQMDRRMVDAVERLSTNDLERYVMSGQGEMCGIWPMVYGIAAARAAGASHGVRYRSATSGDVTGDKRRVVGYAAMGIMRTPLSNRQRQELLELARRTVTRQVNNETVPEPRTTDPVLRADGAAFVTLNGPDGRLRGCIGSIVPNSSLYESVSHNAVAAAIHDPRFTPVRQEEVRGLAIEVSVLSPLVTINDPAEIVIGRHGLYLEKGMASSVFLPQVAVEQGWDLPTYLAQLALKAGLPADGWHGARLSVFSAEVIREHGQ